MTSALFADLELHPTLVGRNAEAALLRECLEGLVEGRGGVVMAVGSEGTGKTCLLQEAGRQGEELNALVFYGSAAAGSPGLPYGLFIEVLSACLRHLPEGEQEGLCSLVAQQAPHLFPTLFPDAEQPASQPSDVNAELRQLLFTAGVVRHLLQLAGRRPLVLCLEDLQLADSASLQLLRQLAVGSARTPLLLLGSYRPHEGQAEEGGELQESLRFVRERTTCREVTLEPLSLLEVRTMVSSCFAGSGFGNAFIETIYDKSGGVPLFVLHYLERLRDQGVIYQRHGLWMDRPMRKDEVPVSPGAALQERLSDLEEEEQQVLAQAAVQGVVFASELVARRLTWPHERVLRVLDRLEQIGHLVYRCGTGFRFDHAFVHNACYARQDADEKSATHLFLASCLEAEGMGDPELLAHHFWRAGAFARALPHLLQNARRSADACAYWEAHTFLEQGLMALESMPEGAARRDRRLEILLLLAEVDGRLGELDRAEELGRQVLALCTAEESEAIGRALLNLGGLSYRRGDWAAAIEHFHRAGERFAESQTGSWGAVVQVRLGNIDFERGHFDRAADRFRAGLGIAAVEEHRGLLGSIHGNLGVIASVQGDHRQALVCYGEALEAYRQEGHRYGQAQTYHNLGMTYAAENACEEALTCYTEGENLAREMGTMDVVANILVSRVAVQIALFDLDGAESSCGGARLYMGEMEDRLGLAECDKMEGVIRRQQQRYGEAALLLEQSQKSFGELENGLGVAECELELGLLQQLQGDLQEAGRHLSAAAEQFVRIGAKGEAERVAELLAELKI